MEKIEFTLFGLHLLEPMALITNSLIAIVCSWIFFKLFRKNKTDEYVHYWALFFLTFALSTFGGGFAHLFYNYTGDYGKIPVFSLAVIANFFIDRACFTLVEDRKKRDWIEYILIAKTVLSVLLIAGMVEYIGKKIFLIVQFNTIITAAGILVWFGIKTKDNSDAWKYFFFGIGILLITALVQILKINIHLWFNKDDFSHILITISMLLFYKGVKRFKSL
ncbi:MAG: hypothetical protein R2799_04605 [Crocinitomicaceae bacterium]